MFEFITKQKIWDCCEKGYLSELDATKISYQLKTAQDLACYDYLREKTGEKIAEIGGGNSRILPKLGKRNRCYNIEKFEGIGLGPREEIHLHNVSNINAYVGDYGNTIPTAYFDSIFSISVVEHIPTVKLSDFFRDSMRILSQGGLFLHAIDLYIEEEPTAYWKERFEIYREWIRNNPGIIPIGTIYNGPLQFKPEMASNPDNILYSWNSMAPELKTLRSKAQNVSVFLGGIKR